MYNMLCPIVPSYNTLQTIHKKKSKIVPTLEKVSRGSKESNELS